MVVSILEITTSSYSSLASNMHFRCLGQIISDLFLTPNSQFDPLGRSIMVSLTSEEIDKWF